MQRPNDEFWHSSFAKVVKMIDMYTDELQLKAAAANSNKYQSRYFNSDVKTINSFKEMEGW